MRRPPPLPDLGTLTEAQKDELIVSLWQTLVAIEGTDGASRPAGAVAVNQGPLSTAAPPSTDSLREHIRQTPPSRRAQRRTEVHDRLCVQRRLACSAGDKPAGVKVRAP